MKKVQNSFILFFLIASFFYVEGQETSLSKSVWVSDNGDGTYSNPIIAADYSDPDVIRVEDKFYMTASSFNCIPGLPILESYDLVNWKLIGYGLNKLPQLDVYDKPQHGNGVWAPCIRYHKNEFYIYYPDPDFGIYRIKAKTAYGPWSEPVLVKSGKGLIDPTPLFDDDGKAYLIYAFAGSRAGIKSVLVACTMNEEGSIANNDEVLLIDGHQDESTIEGPKIYKKNGYYYIFAPAGGVATGWQTILRSKTIFGPYEKKKVLEQGTTTVNGPHQGAWVQTQSGEEWFIHFQDKGALGRITHLQPMKWKNDWPEIGIDLDGNGIGEPVTRNKKPTVGMNYSLNSLPSSDEFNETKLGLQWQWHANPKVYWGFPTSLGYYMLNCIPKPKEMNSLWEVPNLLLQKFPSEEFTATAKITFQPRFDEEEVDFVVMGMDYSALKLKQVGGKFFLSHTIAKEVDKKGTEKESTPILIQNNIVFFQVQVMQNGICTFFYSENGADFKPIGTPFLAKEGKWIGAKIGFVALRNGFINDAGNVKLDWIRFNKL
jgi:beta-xylosidase